MKQKIIIALTIIAASLSIGYGLFKQKPDQNIQTAPVLSLEKNGTVTEEREIIMSEVYKNEEAGILFFYPKDAKMVKFIGRDQKIGSIFGGTITLETGGKIYFDGNKPVDTKPRGGMLSDIRGYENINGEYFLKFPWGLIKVVPTDYLPINNGKDKAIVIFGSTKDPITVGEGEWLTSNNMIAVVNTNKPNLSGLFFLLTSKGETIDARDKKIFIEMMSSIVFK